MRNNNWLDTRLNQIWSLLFPDVKRLNSVKILFGKEWKNTFGVITKNGKNTTIIINGLFKNNLVPEYIIDLTIAHELVHYWHGFNSPYKQKYKDPHKGGIVSRELKKRGFGHMMVLEKRFMKQWPKVYELLLSRKKGIL